MESKGMRGENKAEKRTPPTWNTPETPKDVRAMRSIRFRERMVVGAQLAGVISAQVDDQ
jgi:hypothetical protein